jgi:hypothetical protein
MKRFFGVVELSKSEQRVVLIVMLVLIAFAFTRYERRIHDHAAHVTSAIELKASPTPMKTENDQ